MDRQVGRTAPWELVLSRLAKIPRTSTARYSAATVDPAPPTVLDLLVARADELRERLASHPDPDSAPCRALRRQLGEIDVALVNLRSGEVPPPVRLAHLLREPLAPLPPSRGSRGA